MSAEAGVAAGAWRWPMLISSDRSATAAAWHHEWEARARLWGMSREDTERLMEMIDEAIELLTGVRPSTLGTQPSGLGTHPSGPVGQTGSQGD